VAQEKKTLTIQAEKISDVKCQEKLKASEAWILIQHKRFEQIKGFLLWTGGWLTTGFPGLAFYLVSMVVFSTVVYSAGINRPSKIACESVKSDCYLLRLDKTQVVLPEQVEHLTREYLKSLLQQKH